MSSSGGRVRHLLWTERERERVNPLPPPLPSRLHQQRGQPLEEPPPLPRVPPPSPRSHLLPVSHPHRHRRAMADADELAAACQDSDAAAGTSNLFQVMRAVEATIRHQLEENSRLKEELMRKTRELDRIEIRPVELGKCSGLSTIICVFVALVIWIIALTNNLLMIFSKSKEPSSLRL
ncbi:hypothetical protein VPH35_128002 [Triticum aestivum]